MRKTVKLLAVFILISQSIVYLGGEVSAEGKSLMSSTSTNYVLAGDDDFIGNADGEFRYIGKDEYVEIPHMIKGVNVTSYVKMFSDYDGAETSNVKGVKSTNENITDMSYMFSTSKATELDLSSFVTDNVTDMVYMFQNSKVTVLDLRSFNTSNVTNMGYMFSGSETTKVYVGTQADADNFNNYSNKPGGLIFKVKDVNGYVLAIDTDFRIDEYGDFRYIGKDEYVEIPHTIKDVDVTSYERMFEGTGVKGVKSTNENVTNMRKMFYDSRAEELDLGYLYTSGVTDMYRMFSNSKATKLNVSEFDTNNVMNMGYMFSYSRATSLNLSSFDTSNVTDMSYMFYNSHAKSLDLSSFVATNVTNMSYMFNNNRAEELILGITDTGSVTDMEGMFYSCKATELDLSSFDTSGVTATFGMFSGSQATIVYARSQADADKFNKSSSKPNELTIEVEASIAYVLATDTDFKGEENGEFRYVGNDEYVEIPPTIKGVNVTSYERMFSDLNGAVTSNVKGVKSTNENVTDMHRMFLGSQATELDLSLFDTSSVVDMSMMFDSSRAKELDVISFDTSNVTNMSYMFSSSQATTLDLSSFETGNVTDMSRMFSSSQATTLDLSSFDTSNVTNMSYMFSSSQATTLDLSSFDTSSVKNMRNMFSHSWATVLDLSSFETGNVTDMSGMFSSSQATTLDLSLFDTSNVTNMSSMFWHSQATALDLSSFDTDNVTDMQLMFSYSEATALDLSKFDTRNVMDMSKMFSNSKATRGIARTQEDADKFNNSSYKPKTLNFVIKGSSEINFVTNGNDKYEKVHSTKVEVEVLGDDLASSQYQWTDSKNFPTSGTWKNFQNNDTLSIEGTTGDYYLHIKSTGDLAITTKETSEVFKLDNDAPKPTLSISTADVTNEDVVITVKATDEHSGVKQIRMVDDDWINTDETTFSVSENGTYTFEVEDKAGNTITETIEITNIDKTVPLSPSIISNSGGWQTDNQTITITHGTDTGGSGVDRTEYKIGVDGKWLTYDKAFDIVQEGQTIIYARTVDKAGNNSDIVEETVKIDRIAPTLTLHGQNPLILLHGDKFIDPGFEVEDNFDENVIVNVDGKVDTKTVGTYKIMYKATDHAGNTGTVTRTVNVVDGERPIITLLGDNPSVIEAGIKYIEPGATVQDNVDGDISDKVDIIGGVDVNKIGVYKIRYNVSDEAGNKAFEAIREVHVVAPKAIVLELDQQSVPVYGGTLVKIKDTNAIVQLPSDLPDGTTLKVESSDIPLKGYEQAGEVLNFIFTYPDGEEDYVGNFCLTLGVDEGVEDAAIYHYNEDDKKLEFIGGEMRNGQITAKVNHFSTYGVFSQVEEEAIPPKEEKREKKDSLLPKTATNAYNWLLLGSLFIIFAIIILGINRKRQKVK